MYILLNCRVVYINTYVCKKKAKPQKSQQFSTHSTEACVPLATFKIFFSLNNWKFNTHTHCILCWQQLGFYSHITGNILKLDKILKSKNIFDRWSLVWLQYNKALLIWSWQGLELTTAVTTKHTEKKRVTTPLTRRQFCN